MSSQTRLPTMGDKRNADEGRCNRYGAEDPADQEAALRHTGRMRQTAARPRTQRKADSAAWNPRPRRGGGGPPKGAHLKDMDEDRTALWSAACAGNWRVVTVLLRAGANPRGAPGRSAAECTRRARQDGLNVRRTILDRGRPTVEDFDRVLALLESAERRALRARSNGSVCRAWKSPWKRIAIHDRGGLRCSSAARTRVVPPDLFVLPPDEGR
jgi:hypothetical protein